MTIAKDSMLTKVATGFVAFTAGLLMLGLATPAAAQSDADLQAQIQSLLETIASLQAQVDGGASAGVSGSCPSSIFSVSLGMGAQGQTVQDLQMFLNMDADTRVSTTGPGSPGQESMYYGQLTADAVSAFQVKYASDVLTPVGLTSSTGYWGSSSASHAQTLCADMADDSDDMDDDSDDSDDSDSSDLDGGEASLEDFDISTGDDNDVEEGNTAEVADVEFDVEDGDVRVSRIDVALRPTSGNTAGSDDEPWDVFEEVSIMVDGDEVASMDASDEDDYLSDDADGDGYYELRFSNLDWVVRDGDTAEFTVAVEVSSNVDEADNTVSWDVNILDEGIRAIDSAGIQSYTGNTDADDAVSFDIDEEGGDEEITVTTSSDDPDESTIQVDEDDRSDEYGVFAFDMEAEGSDLELNEILVNLTFANNGTDDYGDIVSDAYIEIDGEQFDVDEETYTNEAATATLSFDIDGDYTIDEDDEVTAMLFLEFNAQDGNYDSGVTVQADVDASDFDVEGADDLSGNQLAGSATGEAHTLLTSGIYAADEADTSASQTEGLATYEFVVDLTAFESDVYLSATSSSNKADAFVVTTSDNGTTTWSFVSDADEENNGSYRIDEGSTEEFTITVTYDPETTGSYRANLTTVKFDTTNSGNPTGETYTFSPQSDYRTGSVTVPGTGEASVN